MSIRSDKYQTIPVENLLIDLQNPRYDPRENQREALETIVTQQGSKLVTLAVDIVDKGLNPSDLIMVTPLDTQEGLFVVLEGNRRIAAIKLLASPKLAQTLGLAPSVVKKFKTLYEETSSRIPCDVDCVVLTREEANHWILTKHTGENDGVGVVSWDGLARHRFRGSSLALQALDLVQASDYLDQATRDKLQQQFAITNLERIIITPDACAELGITVENGKLSVDGDEALARLAIIVTQVANRIVKVSDIDTKEQRVRYAKQIASLPLPVAKEVPAESPAPSTAPRSATASDATVPDDTKQQPARRIGADRRTLIPKRLKLVIPQSRINKIYQELQRLKLEDYPNACAIMFRVFVELSIDYFGQKNSISFRKTFPQKTNPGLQIVKEVTLVQKVTIVADYMEDNGTCTKAELAGIRAAVSNQGKVLGLDSWHAFVHNMNFSPSPADLRATWDNVQRFVELLWQ